MSTNESPLIIMGSNERYALPLAVVMLSAIQHSSVPLQIVILSDRITDASRDRLKEIALRAGAKSFQTIDAGLGRFANQHIHNPRLSTVIFARLNIASLLPDAQRCIYLDSDVMVRRDLTELWNVDLNGNVVAAVQCYHVPIVSSPTAIPYVTEANVDPLWPFFNSGVVLMDLNAWRTQDIESDIAQFLAKYGESLPGADQDILNAVLLKRWLSLPTYWNDQIAENLREKTTDGSRRPAESGIRHFSGPLKPWNSGLFDSDCHQWLAYAARSGFYSPVQLMKWRIRRFAIALRTTSKNAIARYA